MCPLHHSPAPTISGILAFPPPCKPWVLYGTIGLLMGAGYPENPGEAEHVPQGGSCTGSLLEAGGVVVDGVGQGYDCGVILVRFKY